MQLHAGSNGGSVSDDQLFADATAYAALGNGVSEALSWYVSDYQFQPDEKDVRHQLRLLRARIDRFKSQLPQEYEALGKFIYDTYTGTAFLRDDLKPSENDLIALQDEWREEVGFIAIRETLETVQRYVLAAEQCLGKKKPLNHRVQALVRNLARVWHARTGRWPTSGRHPDTAKQTGPFADFVRIANEVLPPPFRVGPLDDAIRQVCKRAT